MSLRQRERRGWHRQCRRAGGRGTGAPTQQHPPVPGLPAPGLTAGSCRSSAGCNAPAACAKTASWGRRAAVPALRSGGRAAHPTGTRPGCRQLEPRSRRLPALLWLSPGGRGLAGPGLRSRASPPPARPSASPGSRRARAAQPRGGAPAPRDGPGAGPREGMEPGMRGWGRGCWSCRLPSGLYFKASRSIPHQCASPAQVPLRSLLSLNERWLMASARCCLLHCPVPHVSATFVSGDFPTERARGKVCQRRWMERRAVSETKLTPSPFETLLSFLSQHSMEKSVSFQFQIADPGPHPQSCPQL